MTDTAVGPDDQPKRPEFDLAPPYLDVGHAVSYGWETLRRNPVPWLATTGLGFVLYLMFLTIVQLTEPRSWEAVVTLFTVMLLGLWLLQAALIGGALAETDGYRPTFGTFLRVRNLGWMLLTALLATTAATVLCGICLLPVALAVGVFTMFALPFASEGEKPIPALRYSCILVWRYPGPAIRLALCVVVMALGGLALCGVGLLAAGPVSAIAVAYSYRVLIGDPIARK